MSVWILFTGTLVLVARAKLRLNILNGIINTVGGAFLAVVTISTAGNLYN